MMLILKRAGLVALGICTACSAPVDVAVDSSNPAGCYVIATGAVSRWRPRAWLAEPTKPASSQFVLKATGDSTRYGDDVVSLHSDTTEFFGQTSNWRVRPDHSIYIDRFDVDWGYTMTLTPVAGDSVRGYVKFSGDGMNGTSRVVGHRSECPPRLNGRRLRRSELVAPAHTSGIKPE